MNAASQRLASTLWWVAVVALLVLFVPRLVGLFPLGNDVTAENSPGEDWLQYHENALSVLNDGWSMPSVKGPYYRPAGFGYTYFIAAVYAVAGARTEAVYLVQGLLLMASIIGLYLVVRRELSPLGGAAALLLITAVLYVDVYRSLPFRLLAENLLFPLTTAAVLLLQRGARKPHLALFALVGAVCGLCFLARPNALLYGPAMAALVALALPGRGWAWRLRAAIVIVVVFSAVYSLVSLRNYATTGTAGTTTFSGRTDWSMPGFKRNVVRTIPERVRNFFEGYGRRLAFVAGVPMGLQPGFRVRPHWLATWAGVALYLAQLRRRTPAFWERAVLVLCICYFAPVVAIGNLSSYGIRMVTPGIPLALLLAIKAVDVAIERRVVR